MKNKLSKKQRNKGYKDAYSYMQREGFDNYTCIVLKHFLGYFRDCLGLTMINENFPELTYFGYGEFIVNYSKQESKQKKLREIMLLLCIEMTN